MSKSFSAASETESSRSDEKDFHVMIPAFKATPSSITRHSTAVSGNADHSSPSRRAAGDVSTGTSATGASATGATASGHPHVPHEPYKAAVWSKPVRVSHGRNSARSTPRSSKPPSRSISRTSNSFAESNSSVWPQRGKGNMTKHNSRVILDAIVDSIVDSFQGISPFLVNPRRLSFRHLHCHLNKNPFLS